jgi:hypothetical protein
MIGPRELEWLLDGLDYTRAHQRLYYRAVAWFFLYFYSIKYLQYQSVMLCTGYEFGPVEIAWWCRRT